MSGSDFAVTFLRNATAYGPSPRMRFDIVLNDLCALAYTGGRIAMISDGSPWRPLVHVEDICEAVRRVIEAPIEAVQGNVLNVGATSQNFRIREIAEAVGRVFPGCEVTAGPPSGDNRSYRVSFEKIAAVLPGYSPRWALEDGARELLALFHRIDFSEAAYRFRAFTRLRQLQYLRQTGQIDADLRWVHA
jgi:nucleoside-diphosphate-sugar epimerase